MSTVNLRYSSGRLKYFIRKVVDGTTGVILNAGITPPEPSGIEEVTAEYWIFSIPEPDK